MMDEKAFYEKLGEIYPEEMLVMSTPSGIALYEFVCSELDKMTGSLVDFGCGKGRFTLYYASKHPKDCVVGVDIAESNCKVGRLRAALLRASAGFVAADLTASSEVGVFDNLICIETIEHLPKLGNIITNIASAVKSGGKVIITVPNQKHSTNGYVPSNEYLQAFGINERYFHCGYTVPELRALFPASLFDVIEAKVHLVKSVLILRRK